MKRSWYSVLSWNLFDTKFLHVFLSFLYWRLAFFSHNLSEVLRKPDFPSSPVKLSLTLSSLSPRPILVPLYSETVRETPKSKHKLIYSYRVEEEPDVGPTKKSKRNKWRVGMDGDVPEHKFHGYPWNLWPGLKFTGVFFLLHLLPPFGPFL